MRGGLYKVGFKTRLGTGFGVVVLQQGRLLGGDSSSFYVGTYTITGNRFTAEVQLNRHTSASALRSVFGVEHARLRLEGDSLGDEALMRGTSPDAPEVAFGAVLQHLTA